jgi:[methyl-Co(III) methanol-specific corrinoid protein]:coenzyme M methyltransferase
MVMNSYDIVMEMLKGNKDAVERMACINSVSMATIDFMKAYDAYWPKAHFDPEKMARLGAAAHKLCGLDNITIPFDMTMEAELMGARINYHEDKIKWPSMFPDLAFHAKEISDIKVPNDISTAGRVPTIISAIKILKKEFEGKVPVNVYITPPFTSISSYVVDSIDFLKMVRSNPQKIHGFIKASMPIYRELMKLFTDAGADIITFHEMGGSNDNVSPKQWDEFIKPYLKELISCTNLPVILNICGSALMIVDRMMECGAKGVAVDERTPIIKAKEIMNKINPKIPLIGNIPSFGIIHRGSPEDIKEIVKLVIDNGVDIVSPGCDFWLETPTDHIKALVDATKEIGTPPPWKK